MAGAFDLYPPALTLESVRAVGIMHCKLLPGRYYDEELLDSDLAEGDTVTPEIRAACPYAPARRVLDSLDELAFTRNLPIVTQGDLASVAHAWGQFCFHARGGVGAGSDEGVKEAEDSLVSSSTTSRGIPSSNQISELTFPAFCALAVPASGRPAEMQNRGASRDA